MSDLQKRADDVILRLNRRRKTHACYPCAKRKVRCDGAIPCSVCKKRNHPEICFYAKDSHTPLNGGDSRSGHLPTLLEGVESWTTSRPAVNHVTTDSDPKHVHSVEGNVPGNSRQRAPVATSLGDLSSAHYLQNALGLARPHNDIRSGLGLTNIVGANASPGRHKSVLDTHIGHLLPTRAEVLRFLQPFRINVMPFYPVILDMDVLELAMHQLLNRGSVREQESLQADAAAEVALSLAVLAVGAQFADLPIRERDAQSQGMVDRCDTCLRLARHIANPSPQVVQTLILIGLQAQNAGRSDEAWSLLGLTYRLAQSLGLDGRTESEQHFLWGSVLWQDSLLSLRYDRRPMYTKRLELAWPEPDRGADYFCCMLNVCRLTRAYLLADGVERRDALTTQQRIANVIAIENSAAAFLKDPEKCSSVQQRLKCYALRMHTSYLISEMCRPFLVRYVAPGLTSDTVGELHQLGAYRLQLTIEAYLEMSQFSVLPLRSWSLTFEIFAAVCITTLLGLRQSSPEIDALLAKFQSFLEQELANESAHQAPATYSMLQRGRQLFKLLEISSQQESRARPNIAEANGSLPQSPISEGFDDQLLDFDALYERFFDNDPLGEMDGTLLSMFTPVVDEMSANLLADAGHNIDTTTT